MHVLESIGFLCLLCVDVTFSIYELSLNISGITIVVCINSLDRKGGRHVIVVLLFNLLCSPPHTFYYQV